MTPTPTATPTPTPVAPHFAGYGNFAEFEGPTICGAVASGVLAAYPPNGAQNGDVFATVIGVDDLAPNTSLQLPAGWSLVPLANQEGATRINAPLPCEVNETAWVAVHTYSTSDAVPYSFGVSVTTNSTTCGQPCVLGEAYGFLASYRGASVNEAAYQAYAYANTASEISMTQPITVNGPEELVNLFEGTGDNDGGCQEQFENLTGNPAATAETPAIPDPTVHPFMDADIWTGLTAGTFGGYGVTSACAVNVGGYTLPALQILLPPAN